MVCIKETVVEDPHLFATFLGRVLGHRHMAAAAGFFDS